MPRFAGGQTVCAFMAEAGRRTEPSVLTGEGIPWRRSSEGPPARQRRTSNDAGRGAPTPDTWAALGTCAPWRTPNSRSDGYGLMAGSGGPGGSKR